MRGSAAKEKVKKVMHEFKVGSLHSGSKKGPKVKSRAQAIAIAMKQSGQDRGGGGATRRALRAKKRSAA